MAGSGTTHLRPANEALLRVENLVVEYPIKRPRGVVHAVSDVSFDIVRGETLGLVGESGCGKSSAARAVLQLPTPTRGSVRFHGREITGGSREDLRELRRHAQLVLQDPVSSLNPRRSVGSILREPLRVWKEPDRAADADRIAKVLTDVGLDPDAVGRRPRQFSGGQCQRISIARCLLMEPELIVCDEPVSALDVSVQAQILNLLEEMKQRYGLTLLFIAHNLAVVKNISDRVAVMYLGKLCEVGAPDALFAAPAHPYTAALLAAIPEPDPEAHVEAKRHIGGDVPSPLNPPSGCRFRTRCPRAVERCAREEPTMREVGPERYVACHFPLIGPAAPVEGTL